LLRINGGFRRKWIGTHLIGARIPEQNECKKGIDGFHMECYYALAQQWAKYDLGPLEFHLLRTLSISPAVGTPYREQCAA
jgi:hypothetical protein